MTIQEAIKETHECMIANGFHNPPPSIPAILAMINSELGEALEADRNESRIKKEDFSWLQKKKNDNDFASIYRIYVKDTIESALAGVCLRIFDLAGLLNLEIWIPPFHLQESDLPGNIMEAMREIAKAYMSWEADKMITGKYWNEKDKEWYAPLLLRHDLSSALGIIFAIAKKLDIDLWSYIKEAMRYNRLREYRHGKKY